MLAMAPTKFKNTKFYKKYLKTLQWSKGFPHVTNDLVRAAPVPVLKLLSNAAIIGAKGNLQLTPKQRAQFSKNRRFFQVLGNRGVNFEQKRQYLVQKGGAAFIPILLSTLIPIVGELLTRAFTNK